MSTATDRPAGLLLLVAGFMLWASAFVLLYAALSIACAFDWDRFTLGPFGPTRTILLVIWAGHLALGAWLLVWCWRRFMAADEGATRSARFIEVSALSASAAALAAIFWTGLPILGTSTCI